MKCFCVLFIIVIFSACTRFVEKNKLSVITNQNVMSTDTLAMIPDLIEDWNYTLLETTDSSLLGIIGKIRFDQDYIFIQSGGSSGEIFVFNTEGKYLNTIGTKGRGPAEFIQINSWNINPYEKEIVIWDYTALKLKRYAYDGSFRGVIEGNKDLLMMSNFFFLQDGDILVFNAINFRINEEWVLYTSDFKKKKVLSFRNVTYEGMYPTFMNNIGQIDDSTTLMRHCCDTIYRYADQQLIPMYYMDVCKTVPQDFSFDGQNIESIQKIFRDKGYNSRILSYETSRYLIQCFMNQTVIWDKIQQKGIAYDGGEKHNGKMPTSSSGIIGVYKDCLVMEQRGSHLLEYKQSCIEEHLPISDKLQKLFDVVKEGDNPVLIFYKLKNQL